MYCLLWFFLIYLALFFKLPATLLTPQSHIISLRHVTHSPPARACIASQSVAENSQRAERLKKKYFHYTHAHKHSAYLVVENDKVFLTFFFASGIANTKEPNRNLRATFFPISLALSIPGHTISSSTHTHTHRHHSQHRRCRRRHHQHQTQSTSWWVWPNYCTVSSVTAPPHRVPS